MRLTIPTNSTDRRWLVLAVTVAAQFMVVLDVAVVNVALPSIKTDLGFSETNLQWIVTAYAVMFGGALLLGGRMSDLLGRRRLFMIADRVPRSSGARRSPAFPGRAFDPDHHVPRGTRAERRARRLGRRLGKRRRGGRPARRGADRLARLVVDLLHQHSGRHRTLRSLSAPCCCARAGPFSNTGISTRSARPRSPAG